jgi:hypothetical protein
MIRAIVTSAFLVLAAVSAQAADSLTLAPKYAAAGTNPDGSAYTGTVAIKVISDTTFAIQWTIAGSVYKGFGMRRNGALAATYMIEGEPGLIIYEVGDGGQLNGLWAIRGHSGNGAEKLTPSN